MLKIVKDDDKDDLDSSINKVAKQIVKDCKGITHDQSKYNVLIHKSITADSVSNTLHALLAAVSPMLQNYLPALMVSRSLGIQLWVFIIRHNILEKF